MSSMQQEKTKKRKVKEEEEEEDNLPAEGEDEDEAQEEGKPALRNDSNEAYFELSSTRRLTVRQYRKKTMVDIREYYEKDGKKLPGKKGITLNLEQYEALRELVVGGAVGREIKALES